MKTIYHISGLGADDRVFKFLQLKDVNKKFIQWIKPDSQESLSEYCKRLTSQIDPADKIVLIGNDRIFPIGRIKNAIVINGGRHFMIVNRAKEISELLQREITL